jgi:hypothetical protein
VSRLTFYFSPTPFAFGCDMILILKSGNVLLEVID